MRGTVAKALKRLAVIGGTKYTAAKTDWNKLTHKEKKELKDNGE